MGVCVCVCSVCVRVQCVCVSVYTGSDEEDINLIKILNVEGNIALAVCL